MTGYVYFIQSGEGGPIKIGWSEKPEARVSQLQSAHHDELVVLKQVIADKALEAELHLKLAAHRVRGEWFADCDEVREAMDAAGTPKRRDYNVRARRVALIGTALAQLDRCKTAEEAEAIFADLGRALFQFGPEVTEEAAA